MLYGTFLIEMATSPRVNTDGHSRLSPILSRDEDSSSNIPMTKARNISSSSSSSTSTCISNSSSSSSNTGTQDIVTQTLKDVISLQHNAMRKIRTEAERQKLDYVLKVTYDEMVRQYNDEKLEHEKTQILLQKEHDRLRFAIGEIEILKQHLEREKYEHDELVKSSHQRVSRENKRSDLLHQQCSKYEETIEALRDELNLKDNEIFNLKQRLKSQKNAHKNLLDDIELQKVQQAYMSRSLNRDSEK